MLEAREGTGRRGIENRRMTELEGREATARVRRDVKRSVGEINWVVGKRGTRTGVTGEEKRGGGKEEGGGSLVEEEKWRGGNGDGGVGKRAVDVEGRVPAAWGGGEGELENWRMKWRAG